MELRHVRVPDTWNLNTAEKCRRQVGRATPRKEMLPQRHAPAPSSQPPAHTHALRPSAAAESKLSYSPEVLALWGESDEKASDDWRAAKIKDFEEGGKMKETHETMEKLQEWMDEKIYGVGGTMDKTLKLRGSAPRARCRAAPFSSVAPRARLHSPRGVPPDRSTGGIERRRASLPCQTRAASST